MLKHGIKTQFFMTSANSKENKLANLYGRLISTYPNASEANLLSFFLASLYGDDFCFRNSKHVEQVIKMFIEAKEDYNLSLIS